MSIVTTQTGSIVITGSNDGTLRTHALTDGRQSAPHVTSALGANAMAAFRSEGDVLAVVSRFKDIEVWNLTCRQHMGTFRGHSAMVLCVALCRVEGRVVAVTGSDDAEVLAWDLVTRAPIGESMTGHTAGIQDVCAKVVDGKPLLGSASSDGTVRLWDLRTGQAIADPLGGHLRGATAIDFGVFNDRYLLLTGAGDGQIRMWDLASHEPVDLDLEAHPDGIVAVRLETLGGRLFAVTADDNGLLRAWDLHTARRQAEVNVGSGINDMALTSDGDLCVATNMGVVALRLNPATDPGVGQPA